MRKVSRQIQGSGGGEEREGWNPDLRDLDAKDLSERKE